VTVTEGLTKRFGDETVVQDLTFSVPAGTIFGLIGPSGSGKTTTIRLLMGIYAPTEGQVRVLGQDPQRFTPGVRAELGYMPQQFVLYPELSVWENMNFSASLYGMGLRRGPRLRELLEFVELYEHRHKLARSISGGMQRRLALAATLVHRPRLIFLDEPTAGIDPVLRRKFWDYFQELKKRGRTVFVTTQYVGEAAYCDWVAIMAEGRLLMVETPDGLRKRTFGGDMVELSASRPLDYRMVAQIRTLPYVVGRIEPLGDTGLRIVVDDAATAIPALIDWARDNNLDVTSVDKYEPPLDDVFVEAVKKEQTRG
jgi:ABC-2 type transport system ATP-binding protein